MFCTVNDCEICYDELDEGKPKLIHKGLRYGQVQVFSSSNDECSDGEEELEELN